MSYSMPQIVRDRAADLLKAFNNLNEAPPKMALGGPDIMKNMTLLWTGSWVEDVKDQSWFFLHPTNPARSSVWAVPGYNGYRDAYKRFVTQAYGLANPMLPAGLDVDHLQARETVPAGSVIRLEAVGKSSNRSHGAGVEKRMAGSQVTTGRKTANHTPGSMTWLVALKLAGVMSPKVGNGKSARERKAAAVEYFVNNGWPRETVEHGLESLFEVADRR